MRPSAEDNADSSCTLYTIKLGKVRILILKPESKRCEQCTTCAHSNIHQRMLSLRRTCELYTLNLTARCHATMAGRDFNILEITFWDSLNRVSRPLSLSTLNVTTTRPLME